MVQFFPIFSLGTATISLLSYLMLTNSEQQHDFRVMRALGAKPTSIMKIVFPQALAIILISGAIGISFGIFITMGLLIPDPVVSQSTLVSVSAGHFGILCFLSICSLYPTLKSVKKTVVEEL